MVSKDEIKVGMKVRVTNEDGCFEGVVKRWSLFCNELTIEPGFNVDTQKIVSHQLNFFNDKSLKFITIDDGQMNLSISEIEKNSFSQSNSTFDRDCSNSNISGSHSRLITTNHSIDRKINKSMSNDIKLGPHLLLCDSNSIITVLNFIISSNVKSVGLQLYGQLTRDGYISLICLDVSHGYVYILDINGAKEENNEIEVMKLLRVILSDSSIVKIMYNCAFASDILYHQYDINLRNIFDLEVAYAYVNTHGNVLANLNGIQTLIEENLPKIEEFKGIRGKIDWNKRPLSPNSKYNVLYQASYLIDLYRIFYERIFEKFSLGCDLYVNVLKDCENESKLNHFYEDKELLLRELKGIFAYRKDTDRNTSNEKCNKVSQIITSSRDDPKKGDSGIKTSTDNDESVSFNGDVNDSFTTNKVNDGRGDIAIHKMFDRSGLHGNYLPAGYTKSNYLRNPHKSKNTAQ